MTREQLDAELMKGVESMKSGKTYTADEIDAEGIINADHN